MDISRYRVAPQSTVDLAMWAPDDDGGFDLLEHNAMRPDRSPEMQR